MLRDKLILAGERFKFGIPFNYSSRQIGHYKQHHENVWNTLPAQFDERHRCSCQNKRFSFSFETYREREYRTLNGCRLSVSIV